MEFHVLGPLEVLDEGRPAVVTAPRQRALLAVLLAHANEVVSTDRLLDLVWGEDQPDVSALRYQVSKLREALSEDTIATQSPGYVIRLGPNQLDALQFEKLLAEARNVAGADAGRAIELLDRALGLWRGDPYADFTYEEFAAAEIRRLNELRLEAIEARFDALLAQGRDQELVGDLQALVEAHPRRERLTAALMLALYRSGRQADALEAYQALRTELGEGLGLEPSQELVDLEGQILLQDESLSVEAAPPAADFLRGYILRGRIGEGAHGVVWRAAQPGVGREVAIKAIHPDIANRAGFVRRFEMEAQLVASLEHPHIVSLFDFWRDPEGAYLVMPHLRGGNVAGLLLQGPLRVDAALELVGSVGAALSYAHRRGVVHRDVTPQNVLLDDEGNPYLSDFGVAALIGETAGPSSSSPGYLAPEQHAGREAVPESDVYSLGMLAHSVLTGVIPQVAGPVAPPSHLSPDVPDSVDQVFARATAVDVAERFIDPVDFVSALTACFNGGAKAAPRPEVVRNPYKGLRAFGETDSPDFFGRDLAVAELVDAVARRRLVAVVGPSGCGKSSLVRAGLLADLRSGVLPGSDRWLVTDMYPGARPLHEFAEALRRVAVEWPDNLHDQLASGDVNRVLDRMLPRDSELLLVVDQFEELFTQTVAEAARVQFLNTLHHMTTAAGTRCRIVVTLRADFFDRPLGYSGFGELLRRGVVSVAAPSEESLEQAVIGPAEGVGLSVEPGLERAITRDVADQPGGLPLLEYALTELFHERSNGQLTTAGYHKTGGVLGALGRRAEDLYSAYGDEGRSAAQQVFLRLVTVEEGEEDTRRRIPLTELHHMGLDPDALQRVLDDFGGHRLLTFDRDPETREPTVEVAHEALLARWERLRGWIDERRDDLVLHRRLAAAVGEWEESGNESPYLLKGGRLAHYEHFAEETDIALTGRERSYLETSRAAEDEATTRQRRRRMGVLATIASVAVIAVVLAVLASFAQRDAEDARALALENEQDAIAEAERADANAEDARTQRDLAEENAATARAQELAAKARVAMQEDPELAILLALEAVAIEVGGGPTEEAVEALHEAVVSSRLRFATHASQRASVNADGTLVATRSNTEPVKVIRVEDNFEVLELPIAGNPDDGELSEFSVAISPDGTMVATGRTDGTVTMWDVATGDELWTTNDFQTVEIEASSGVFTLAYGGATTNELDISASASAIEDALEQLPELSDVAASGAGTADDPWQVAILETSSPFVRRLESDSSQLGPRPGEAWAEVYDDFAMISIDANAGSFVFILDAATSEPVAFDATDDEVRLALVSLLGMPELLVFGEEGFFEVMLPEEDDGEEGDLDEAEDSDDGPVLPPFAVLSIDLLRPGVATVLGRAHDHPDEDGFEYDSVSYLEFSPDGSVLASRGWDETIRFWEASSGGQSRVLDAPLGPLAGRGVDFSPDGTLLAATDGVSTWVWNVATGEIIREHAIEHDDEEFSAWDVAFSGDGEAVYIARPFSDWGIGLLDLATGEEQPVWAEISLMLAIAVNSDGSLLATADDLGNVHTFATTDYGIDHLEATATHRGWILDLAFTSATDHLLSVGYVDARLTDFGPSGSSEWMTLRNKQWGFHSVTYSEDGTMLARAPVGDDVVIVDSATGDELARLPDVGSTSSDLAFSPDGSLLAVALSESGGFVQVWDIASASLIAQPVDDEDLLATGHNDAYSVDFSPDGRYLAATIPKSLDGSTPPAIRMWDTETFELVLARDPLDDPSENYMELAFTPDGSQLAVRGTFVDKDIVRFYDLDGNELDTCCEHWWDAYTGAPIDFSRDGTRLVTAGYERDSGEGSIYVWDVATGELLSPPMGHQSAVYDVAFSPDGTSIASGSVPEIHLWDSTTYEEILKLSYGNSIIHSVAFSSDGSQLAATYDFEGLTIVWALDLDDLIQMARDRVTRDFTAAECTAYEIDCPLEE